MCTHVFLNVDLSVVACLCCNFMLTALAQMHQYHQKLQIQIDSEVDPATEETGVATVETQMGDSSAGAVPVPLGEAGSGLSGCLPGSLTCKFHW